MEHIGWETYSDAQFEAAAAVVSAITEKYGPQEINGHDDISVGRKLDPRPAF